MTDQKEPTRRIIKEKAPVAAPLTIRPKMSIGMLCSTLVLTSWVHESTNMFNTVLPRNDLLDRDPNTTGDN